MARTAILFDFGGTLDSDGVAWPQRLFPIYRDLGLAAEWDPFLKAFYRSDDALPQRHRLEGLDLERTVALQAADVLEVLAPERRERAAEVARRFARACREQFSRNRPVLEALRSRAKLGIVSNFYGNLSGILEAEGWAPLFDVVADSGVLGVTKPDARIFQHALEALGAEPARAFMVGDSLARDIRGAEALGMGHVWIDPAGQGACCAAGSSVRAFAELPRVLELERVGS